MLRQTVRYCLQNLTVKIKAAFGTLILLIAAALPAVRIDVSDTASLRTAVSAANPGDEIVLLAGNYRIDSVIVCNRPGSPGSPIRVRAEVPGCARILVNTFEGFKVSAPHWTFEGLDMEGICADHSVCEHAFHVVEDADFTTIRGCRLHEFNAMIKGNGQGSGSRHDLAE